MNVITTFFFLILLLLISILPFIAIYGFSDFMRFIMRYLVKYRVKVMQNNLQIAFPDKDIGEIEKLEKAAYKHLIDYIVEGIKAFTMSKRNIVKRHKLLNPELVQPFFKDEKSIIVVTAHYNNWEWGSMSASLQTPYKAVAFYKPLSNKYIDTILRRSRQRCGTKLVSIYETSKTFDKYKNEPRIYLMAADQSPSGNQLKNAFWIDFLGIKTPFLHGVEKHAKNNNYPVVYVDIQQKKRGFYELKLSVLSENPIDLNNGELTKLYANKLENIIQKKPESWLWSHKRWKHVKDSI